MSVLFKDIYVLTPSGRAEKGSVYVSGDRIVSVGEPPEGSKADRVIDGKDRLLMPGLVNSHTHVYMTMFRNCADDIPFSDWLFKRIMPLEDRMTPDDCYWATLLGYIEMLSTGTTASLDMYVFTETAVRAAEEAKVRAVLCRGLTGGKDDEAGGKRRHDEARKEIERWRGKNPLISFMLGPHAPYTCDEGYLKETVGLAAELGLPMNVHVSESKNEIETIKERYGCTPVEFLDRAGVLTDATVAAHCVYLTDGDIDILARRGVNVAVNPVSNLKLGNGAAPVPKLQKKGVKLCLGTDGAASNNALNMFRDMSCLSLVQKGLNSDAAAVSAADVLRMATAGGARALGLEDVGEIRPGMKADLAVVDLDRPWLRPFNDPASSLVYSAAGSEVESVMVNGEFLLDKGELTTIDRERVYYETEKTCRRLGLM
ncbi:MAG: amidohydrolase [Oscillospiraceae bacterium]|nr:amidohydrolase [Oscillospiraceae bacterium]